MKVSRYLTSAENRHQMYCPRDRVYVYQTNNSFAVLAFRFYNPHTHVCIRFVILAQVPLHKCAGIAGCVMREGEKGFHAADDHTSEALAVCPTEIDEYSVPSRILVPPSGGATNHLAVHAVDAGDLIWCIEHSSCGMEY